MRNKFRERAEQNSFHMPQARAQRSGAPTNRILPSTLWPRVAHRGFRNFGEIPEILNILEFRFFFASIRGEFFHDLRRSLLICGKYFPVFPRLPAPTIPILVLMWLLLVSISVTFLQFLE